MKRNKKSEFTMIGISTMLLLSVPASLIGSGVSVFAENSKKVVERTISSSEAVNEITTLDSAVKTSDENHKNTFSLEDGSVSYSANANEYYQEGSYEGIVHLKNKDGNSIPIGTKIMLTFPVDGIDVNNLVLSDPQIDKYFNVTIDSTAGVVTFELKKEIVGDSDISFVVAGMVIGEKGSTYNVDITSSDPDGTPHVVKNANPSFKVKDGGDIPSYGLANAFWGFSPSDVGNFIGKSNTKIEDLQTGLFDRGSDTIQNFVQANPTLQPILGDDDYYTIVWQMTPYDGKGNRVKSANISIDINDFKLYIQWTNGELHPIDSKWYTLDEETNEGIKKVTVLFKTRNELGGAGILQKQEILMQAQAHVDNDGLTCHTSAWVYKTNKKTNETISARFDLNNLFSDKGESTIFPNLTIEDKTFYTGYLNDSNIKEEIMKNIAAKDTNDGDITKDLTVDYSQVNPNVVGDYPVVYTVTNSTGHTSTKTATIHIIEKAEAAPVTVMYLDEDGEKISPDQVMTGKIDEAYQTQAIAIDGYQLLSTPENATGKFTDQPQTVKYIYQGNLLFVEAPETISFGKHPISANDETYQIQEKKNDLKVKDLRKLGSHWSITAQLTQEFIGKQTGKKLEGTLNYRDESGAVQTIDSASSAVIYSKQTEDHEETNVSQNWHENFGLLLDVKSGGAVLDEYDAIIQWTVEDTVSNN